MLQPTGWGTLPPYDPITALGTWPTVMVQSIVQMQRLQWEALTVWPRFFAAVSQEFWDEWTCLYAGGVPIDA